MLNDRDEPTPAHPKPSPPPSPPPNFLYIIPQFPYHLLRDNLKKSTKLCYFLPMCFRSHKSFTISPFADVRLIAVANMQISKKQKSKTQMRGEGKSDSSATSLCSNRLHLTTCCGGSKKEMTSLTFRGRLFAGDGVHSSRETPDMGVRS